MLSADNVVTQAKRYSPTAAAWWVVLIQGIVVGALGIYLMMEPEVTARNVGKAVALYLYSIGIVDVARNRFLPPETPGKTIIRLRAWVAAVVGGICVILLVFDSNLTASLIQPAIWLLGAATLVYGLVGLYLAFAVLDRGSGRLLSIIASVIFAAIGFSVLFLRGQDLLDRWIGPLLIVLGIGLIGFSLYRYQQGKQAKEDAAAVASTTAAAAVAATPAASTATSGSAAAAAAPIVPAVASAAAPAAPVAPVPPKDTAPPTA